MVAPGVLVIDKPTGLTSHDVVSHARRLLGTRRVGHAGTLDPMATGVLVLGIEWGTRLLTYLTGHDKVYSATIRLGASTVTDDAEGDVTATADASGLDPAEIAAAISRLTGDIDQVPAAVSAIKIAGERAYRRVRAGEQVSLAARPVRVSAFDVVDRRQAGTFLDLDARVEVSAGTYVRALARDLGADLGVGGHLTALRRVRSGPFGVGEAVRPDAPDLADRLIGLGRAARRGFPFHAVDEDTAARLRHGQRLPSLGLASGVVAVLDGRGDLVALVTERDGAVRPVAVVPTS